MSQQTKKPIKFCCWCSTDDGPFMEVSKEFMYAKGYMKAAGTTVIFACRKCFESQDAPFYGELKP